MVPSSISDARKIIEGTGAVLTRSRELQQRSDRVLSKTYEVLVQSEAVIRLSRDRLQNGHYLKLTEVPS